MGTEIEKELYVLGRRMELLQQATSDSVNDVFDNGTQANAAALQHVLMQQYADVLDRDAFLDALHSAYVEEGEPIMLNDGA